MSERIPSLLDKLEIEYIEYPNRLAFACPIHGGDNPEGCCIFTDGDKFKGNWQCWTKHCEEDFTNNLIGFVRGVLSFRRNKNVSLNEVMSFCRNFIGGKIEDIADNNASDRSLDAFAVFSKTVTRQTFSTNRDSIRSKLLIPSDYFINRGFLPETLDDFDIGLCNEKNRPMSNRVVVPIYDEDFNYVGCAGRSINNELKPKWLHSKGFKKNVLYGLNVAKDEILRTQSVILVEGQGDVWRMHEAGYKQTVGIFGCSISDDQLLLLESSGALNVIVLTDSDEAGEKAYKQIVKKCGRRFNYYRPRISSKDVGDMTVKQVKEELEPQLKGVINNEQ